MNTCYLKCNSITNQIFKIMSSTNPNPDTTTPLVTTPTPPNVGAAIENGLGQLIRLVGTWNSPPAGTYSWNVMPLPQDNVEDNFILKNFSYLEEITFAEIPGNAPNRGGGFTQVANTLFYEQRVYFAPSTKGSTDPVPDSAVNMLVHAENGSWLFLDNRNQFPGAFSPDGSAPVPLPAGTTSVPAQDASISIVKQMSVPHGNSILAVGSVDPAAQFPPPANPVVSPENPGTPTLGANSGIPTIPQLNTIPTYNEVAYGASKYGASVIDNGIETNSDINPNIKLVNYLSANPPTDYVHFKVTAPAEDITNITFETGHAKVNGYTMEVWILNPGTKKEAIMYYQNIGMALTLSSNTSTDTKTINFPHITCNVLTRATS